MERRTLLAIVLSIAVWAAWLAIFPPHKQDKKKVEQKQIEQPATLKNEKKPDANPVTPLAPIVSPSSVTSVQQATFEIQTKHYSVILSNKGAVIDRITLKDRNMDLSAKSNPYHARGVLDFPIHFSETGFKEGQDLDNAVWSMNTSDKNTVVFSTSLLMNGSQVILEKRYSFSDETYAFNLEYHIINPGKNDLTVGDGAIIFSPADLLGPELNYSNSYNVPGGLYSKDHDFEQMKKGDGWFSKSGDIKKDTGSIDWVGLMSRYYLVIMIPQDFKGSGVIMDNRPVTGFRTGMYVPMTTLKAGSDIRKVFKVYLGEKDKDMLKSVDPSIVKAADISTIIEPIRYFVIWCLKGINKFIGNLGWALVIFSILTKLVFMPLTNKSTESMKKMQVITPKINELRARYKDKPDVLQKETLKLYQENKVNPLGGCLPILVQMPFFFALYSALINSIDLWNAPFIFWMKDLSMPDTVAVIGGINLNILPIIMTATTYIQQKMSTVDTGSQQQKIMMSLMPVMFIFIFWSMPSGLVLYWTLQNIFQIANQLFVNSWAKKKITE